jgi:hypothetical protein
MEDEKAMRMTTAMRTMTLGAATLLLAVSAGAIEIDPGAVGSEFNSASLGVVQASDVPSNELEITFADMKHLELAGDDVLYSFGLAEFTGVLNGIGFTGYLTDMHGQEIPDSAFAGTFETSGWINGNRGFENPTVIHDVHFQFLSTPAFPFEALFVIGTETSSDPKPVVGEWVPEPSAALLWTPPLIGLAGLAAARRRRLN